MEEEYNAVIDAAAELLADHLLTLQGTVAGRARELDGDMRELLRLVGSRAMEHVYGQLARQVVDEARASGLTVDEARTIRVGTIFGLVELPSPYLRNRKTKESARPVRERLGFRGRSKTLTVERALTDFGSEESFGQAEARFEEHYGWNIGRTSILRVVEGNAVAAESYVVSRLESAEQAYDEPIATRPGVAEMLIELDGCEIRTGTLVDKPGDEVTPVRELPARARVEAWREVRVGFVRELLGVERTFVALMDKYPPVVRQLFQASVERGLSSETEVVAVCDGGTGLREELEAQFPGLFFVLDHPHLAGHLYETAGEMELEGDDRHAWVRRCLDQIEPGDVTQLISQLAVYEGPGVDRVTQLCGYLTRFADAVDYDTARECGWPIGSGEVESAHRYIPQKRLKLPGACWRPETINPMLALRVIRANGWWHDFWQQRAADERLEAA